MEKSSTVEYGISDYLLCRHQAWDASYYKATVRYSESSKEGIGCRKRQNIRNTLEKKIGCQSHCFKVI